MLSNQFKILFWDVTAFFSIAELRDRRVMQAHSSTNQRAILRHFPAMAFPGLKRKRGIIKR
jgi:hypothetical protein